MELYFTRHGKTEWNLQRRFQGMLGDSPLLPESLEEVALLGKRLAGVPFEAIYCSTSKRARTTAETIASYLIKPAPIHYTDGLRELGLGCLEGQLIDEVSKEHPIQLDYLRNRLDLYDPRAFAGESIQDALARIETVVADAVMQHEGPLLFVGHGASLTAAIQWLAGKDLAHLREMGGLVNNSLTMMVVQEPQKLTPYDLVVYNDASFLGESAGRDALL